MALLLFLIFGIGDEGNFKNVFVEGAVNFLISIVFFYIAVFFFIPIFLLLLLKAALLETPKYKWFNYVAQFITGIFYSLGSCVMIVATISPMHGIPFNPVVFGFGLGFILLGYGLFEIFQAAIQRTPTPQT